MHMPNHFRIRKSTYYSFDVVDQCFRRPRHCFCHYDSNHQHHQRPSSPKTATLKGPLHFFWTDECLHASKIGGTDCRSQTVPRQTVAPQTVAPQTSPGQVSTCAAPKSVALQTCLFYHTADTSAVSHSFPPQM